MRSLHVSARIGEKLEITSRREVDERNLPVVEELWDSPNHHDAIEHTRIEAFEGQIANQSKIAVFLAPVKIALADRLPGYFCLSLREADLASARMKMSEARLEVARLVVEAAGRVQVDDVVTLQSNKLPFTLPSGFDAQFGLFRKTSAAVKALAHRMDRRLLDREVSAHGVTAPKATTTRSLMSFA